MALINKLTAIADAIRGKTGGTDPLTLDQMATEIAGIEAGGGGSMESGELVTTSANFYRFTIPVSSRKTHVAIYPKLYGTMIADPTAGGYVARRLCILLGVDGEGMTEISIRTGYSSDTGMAAGDCYHYAANENAEGKITFDDSAIAVTIACSPWAEGEYYWYAW